MPDTDALAPLLELPGVAEAAEAARSAIARAHRRPAGLRRFDVVASESALRGARASVSLAGGAIPPLADVARAPSGPIAAAISAYSFLAPERAASTVRTFARAPLQVLAGIDAALNGSGTPFGTAGAGRLQALARLIVSSRGPATDQLLAVVVQAEIAASECFGQRSGSVGLVAARAAAMHTGFDPRGFAVPETYLNRHRAELATLLPSYRADPAALLILLLTAWREGGKEADSIARAA